MDWEQAQAAKTDDQMICGTYVGETPRYFLMPNDATDAEVRERAFEIKNGRRMGRYEHFLLDQARKLRGVA